LREIELKKEKGEYPRRRKENLGGLLIVREEI